MRSGRSCEPQPAHLCYNEAKIGGTLGGTRTPNLLVRSQTLYPLSYEGMRGPCALQYTSPLELLLPRAAGRGAIWETNS
jgi:hypothetical protein